MTQPGTVPPRTPCTPCAPGCTCDEPAPVPFVPLAELGGGGTPPPDTAPAGVVLDVAATDVTDQTVELLVTEQGNEEHDGVPVTVQRPDVPSAP